MADLTPLERLQPCLLDRLTDEEPDKKQESRERRVISLRRLREAVLRDLGWLFNTSAHPARDHLDEFTEVPSSVLNFGIPDLCGLTASGVNVEELERRLVEAIHRFEPRILPNTLRVEVRADPESMQHNAIVFLIQGELWAQPMPEALYIKTEIDLESGQFDVQGRSDG